LERGYDFKKFVSQGLIEQTTQAADAQRRERRFVKVASRDSVKIGGSAAALRI